MFSPDQLKLATAAKALSSPVKVAILECLLIDDAWHTACLSKKMDAPIPVERIQKEVAELRSIGLIEGTLQGPDGPRFRINRSNWEAFKKNIKDFDNLPNVDSSILRP